MKSIFKTNNRYTKYDMRSYAFMAHQWEMFNASSGVTGLDYWPVIPWSDRIDGKPLLVTYSVFKEEIFHESDRFNRVFSLKDKCEIDGEVYIIKDILHKENGDIEYLVQNVDDKKLKVFEDEDSKQEAYLSYKNI